MKKPGLDAVRHREIGQRLQEMHRELKALSVEIGNAYPHASKFSRSTFRAVDALSQMRSEGDTELAKEHPEQWSAGVYYG